MLTVRADYDPMASSIHAIHRPFESTTDLARRVALPSDEEDDGERTAEEDGKDYATGTSPATIVPKSLADQPSIVQITREPSFGNLEGSAMNTSKLHREAPISLRRSSRADLKEQRRAVLASKLREVFDLEAAEEVLAGKSTYRRRERSSRRSWAEYPSWFVSSVLLQGYLYLTSGHICFYAFIREKKVSISTLAT